MVKSRLAGAHTLRNRAIFLWTMLGVIIAAGFSALTSLYIPVLVSQSVVAEYFFVYTISLLAIRLVRLGSSYEILTARTIEGAGNELKISLCNLLLLVLPIGFIATYFLGLSGWESILFVGWVVFESAFIMSSEYFRREKSIKSSIFFSLTTKNPALFFLVFVAGGILKSEIKIEDLLLMHFALSFLISLWAILRIYALGVLDSNVDYFERVSSISHWVQTGKKLIFDSHILFLANIDYWLVYALFDESISAPYVIATRIAMVFKLLGFGYEKYVLTVVGRDFVVNRWHSYEKFAFKAMLASILLLSPVYFLFVLFGQAGISMAYGEAYGEVYFYSIPILLGQIINVAFMPYRSAFAIVREINAKYKLGVALAVLYSLSIYVSISAVGVMGAAYSVAVLPAVAVLLYRLSLKMAVHSS